MVGMNVPPFPAAGEEKGVSEGLEGLGGRSQSRHVEAGRKVTETAAIVTSPAN
jgi:hypothetical protein